MRVRQEESHDGSVGPSSGTMREGKTKGSSKPRYRGKVPVAGPAKAHKRLKSVPSDTTFREVEVWFWRGKVKPLLDFAVGT